MLQLYYTILEAAAASIILIPILLALNHFRFRSIKATILYLLFAIYLTAVYAVVGLPNVTYIRLELNLNLIPFADMLSDLSGTLLNVALFVPMGVFLPVLWTTFRQFQKTLLFGFCASLAIEVLQIFTFRATDINDLITNTAGSVIGYFLGTLLIRFFPALKCRTKTSDLTILILFSCTVMFFFQPLIWNLIY